ncbi:TetR/AcrR family transcriptional regulator [Asticcacaulis sp. EMRT-3]|uniref:TetR/AcrR family transcriptional regulator n=1 Tax=Asticcacaulis sp. EMRT-3 TaxID=3040349 RepID=UPI0024AFF27C|nr:TetR/AcrR family transcriptional regulator [Asticcacaulis sp. EMRT-3]MDI7775434.1 TetR/AcrR family transcriptional regulator [Asticcacaulis sp. EMRT-3]
MPSGARARSKERNRLKILDSATQLFRERGFEAATLRDIASAADLSTGALFANFTDKNEIFITVVEAENARVIRVIRDAYDESLPLVERLHRQLMRGYETAEANARLILSAFVMKWSAGQASLNEVARLSDLVRLALFDTLKAAQGAGELPQGAPLDCASEILEDLCFANMRRVFQNGSETGGFDVETLHTNMLTQIKLVIAGLRAEAA